MKPNFYKVKNREIYFRQSYNSCVCVWLLNDFIHIQNDATFIYSYSKELELIDPELFNNKLKYSVAKLCQEVEL